jgi:hypothetical protein
MRCGDFRAVKKDTIPLPERNNLREYDPAIKERYQEELQSQYQIEAQQRKEEVVTQNREAMNEYYQSWQWQKKRKFRLQINDRIHFGLCEVCSDNKATEVHHVTYDRFGNEWLFDLSAICLPCHQSFHPHMRDDGDAPFG